MARATSLTAVDAILTISVAGLFNTPQRIEGWSSDDAFSIDALDNAEVVMGIDGRLSAGFVYVPVRQKLTLQGDQPSNLFFEAWYNNQQRNGIFYATGLIVIPSINRKYTLQKGVLTSYSPIPAVRKILQPREYGITWERIFSGAA